MSNRCSFLGIHRRTSLKPFGYPKRLTNRFQRLEDVFPLIAVRDRIILIPVCVEYHLSIQLKRTVHTWESGYNDKLVATVAHIPIVTVKTKTITVNFLIATSVIMWSSNVDCVLHRQNVIGCLRHTPLLRHFLLSDFWCWILHASFPSRNVERTIVYSWRFSSVDARLDIDSS